MRKTSLAIFVGLCAFASIAHAKIPRVETTAAAPQHFDFDDDVVESGLDRALDGPITAAPRAHHESLIRVRQNFVPELLRSCEGI